MFLLLFVGSEGRGSYPQLFFLLFFIFIFTSPQKVLNRIHQKVRVEEWYEVVMSSFYNSGRLLRTLIPCLPQ